MPKIFFPVLLIIMLASCGHLIYDHGEGKTNRINPQCGSDSVAESVINHYKSGLDSIMNEVIGFNGVPMEKDQPEGVLGNFICDLIMQATDTLLPDTLKLLPLMVLMNNGGFRASLPSGRITVGDVYRVMPFDNKLVVLKMDGERIYCLLRFIIAKGGMPVGGMRMSIHDTIPATVTIGNDKFDPGKKYLVATSDYLANGGDNIPCFQGTIWNSGFLIRDVIIGYYRNMNKQGKKPTAVKDRRIAYE